MSLATNSDALREFAYNAGRDCPDVAWLLHFSDTVVANPFYVGPPVRHPEADEYDNESDGECDEILPSFFQYPEADEGGDKYDECDDIPF